MCSLPELWYGYLFFFFFQAEDGIRDKLVTGVQTCALPIWFHTIARVCGEIRSRRSSGIGRSMHRASFWESKVGRARSRLGDSSPRSMPIQIGRASCRERV